MLLPQAFRLSRHRRDFATRRYQQPSSTHNRRQLRPGPPDHPHGRHNPLVWSALPLDYRPHAHPVGQDSARFGQDRHSPATPLPATPLPRGETPPGVLCDNAEERRLDYRGSLVQGNELAGFDRAACFLGIVHAARDRHVPNKHRPRRGREGFHTARIAAGGAKTGSAVRGLATLVSCHRHMMRSRPLWPPSRSGCTRTTRSRH
jgi:hypothetical protein